MKHLLVALAVSTALAGCATSSGVMEAEGGTFIVSAFAAPARGGATGAHAVAYEEAQKHCAGKGKRAIIVDAAERDVYQSASSFSVNRYGGGGGSATFAAGRSNLRFRCE